MKSEFQQGYACAISSIVSSHGECTATREALVAGGLTTVEKMRDAGVDEYDIEILAPLLKGLKK